MILVTGAAGKTGQAVIEQLVDRDEPVRALVRSEMQAKIATNLGARETVVGDLESPATLADACRGVAAVYLICPNMHPRERSIGEGVIAAAESAGVGRFVYHSVLHPQVEAMPHHWQKMRVEERLFASRLSYTILQPAAYMQNLLAYWERVVSARIYEIPYNLDVRMGLVDLADLAEVAAKVLLAAGHEGAVYELCSSKPYSQHEIAALIGRGIGRKVTAVRIPFDQWERNARAAGLSDYAVSTLLKMFRYYDQHGFWGNSNVLGWLLGRPPTTLDTFLERIIAG